MSLPVLVRLAAGVRAALLAWQGERYERTGLAPDVRVVFVGTEEPRGSSSG